MHRLIAAYVTEPKRRVAPRTLVDAGIPKHGREKVRVVAMTETCKRQNGGGAA
jgi:hypothetical protein